jgi:acetolactate synthase-1/2/3 large subunit
MKKPVEGDRRRFLKATLVLGAAGASAPSLVASAKAAETAASAGSAATPTEQRLRSEFGALDGHDPQSLAIAEVVDPGSDFMVDLLRAADIPYVIAMAGSTFRGLHESIVNYGGNHAPELITCVHEEISAAMCHGYAKVAGKPIACMVHSDVGVQHASMAIYNAWCDRAPMIVLVGNWLDATKRRPWVEWDLSMADVGAIVRDFVKWDDIPVSLQHYSESFMRAREIAMTPPYEPVLLVADSGLQEDPIADRSKLSIPRRAPVSPPAGEPAEIDLVADMLIAAKSPVIVADRAARTAEGMGLVVQLAEALNAPVIDKGGRLNIPTNHYLNQTFLQQSLLAGADVILGLELTDIWGVINDVPDLPGRESRRIVSQTTKVIGISSNYGFVKANVQDIQRYYAADITIAADAQACLPQLIESLNRKLGPAQRQAIAAKKPALEAAFHALRASSAADAARSWDASPIGTGRLCMEIWDQIKGLDWALVCETTTSAWPQRLWDITEYHQYGGSSGGAGVGYMAPAAAGAALAHRDAGRIPVVIQSDGDLMMLPGTLWTLAHHKLPLLMVVHNNRAWHQETMHLQRMAEWRNRGAGTWAVGTTLVDPAIDYATVARGMGVWAEGPISDPAALRPAIARALAVVKQGEPALLDVLTQPR